MKSPAFEALNRPGMKGQIAPVYSVELHYPTTSGLILRPAHAQDLPELVRLEQICFEDWRQDSRRVIRESLRKPGREIWIVTADNDPTLLAALFLRRVRTGLRVYSIATDPAHRGRGLGSLLINHSQLRATALGENLLSLEADATRISLLSWYEAFGFEKTTLLDDFYGPGHHAWRMTKQVTPTN